MIRVSIKDLGRKLNEAVDWFIPEELKSARPLLQGARMFMFSHMFGPFLGNTISFAMLYLRGVADGPWWTFFLAVTGFWAFPPLLRLTGWYIPLAVLSIENLIFCIFWGCYQYGGTSSPILPWLVTVPLLAFFYLPERKTRLIVTLQIIVSLAAFYAVYMIYPPNEFKLKGLTELGLVSTFCASIYVSMMALYFANSVSSQVDLEHEIGRHQTTEKRLREATLQIESAMAAKSDFLAKMSHELRNPLNSIIGYSELMLESLDDRKSQKARDLASIRSAGRRLLELVNDLLDLAKAEAGRMTIASERIQIADLFDELAAQWRPAVESGHNRFDLDPPPAQEIDCDAPKLRRAIGGLLDNAAKFTKDGQVSFSGSLKDGWLTISISDTGVGIAQDRLRTLFEAFATAEDHIAEDCSDGAGLGLPLADRYARLMHGRLSVRSTVGIGSRFTLCLPVGLPDEASADRPKQQPAEAA